MSFFLGLMSGVVLALMVITAVLGVLAVEEVVEKIMEVLSPQPRLLPVRARTAAEQREYEECNRTIRPGDVTYTIRVKRD